MKLYRSRRGMLAEHAGRFYILNASSNASSWDDMVARENLRDYLEHLIAEGQPADAVVPQDLLPTRPELFFKSAPHRVVGPEAKVAIRDDASWSVPEPELTLFVSPGGKIAGYTVGNDMSSRDIEGENPLYLPQAKVYDRSCALGPCLLIADEPLPATTKIALEIRRGGALAFSGATTLKEMKRRPEELVEYLYRNNSFPKGCFLLTGTGVVPPDSFTLKAGDEIRITIPPIGTLVNVVG